MSMFCAHEWIARSGMDGGSICGKCGKTTEKETTANSNSGLSSGVLEEKNGLLRRIFNKDEKSTPQNR